MEQKPFRKVLVFAGFQLVIGGLFAYFGLSLIFFAVFTITTSLVFARFLGGLEKEAVDFIYYMLASIGVVLFALSKPFSLELYFAQATVADYEQRVELLESFQQYPADSLARSDQTDSVRRSLTEQLGEFSDFGSLVVFEDCETSTNELCETRNRKGRLASGATSLDDFWTFSPLALDEEVAASLFSEVSTVKLFANYDSDRVFEYMVPSRSAFVAAMTYDDRSEHYQALQALGAKFLEEDRESLSFHRRELSDLTNYGEPTNAALVAELVWPFVLLVALATKLARHYSRTINVLARRKA